MVDLEFVLSMSTQIQHKISRKRQLSLGVSGVQYLQRKIFPYSSCTKHQEDPRFTFDCLR